MFCLPPPLLTGREFEPAYLGPAWFIWMVLEMYDGPARSTGLLAARPSATVVSAVVAIVRMYELSADAASGLLPTEARPSDDKAALPFNVPVNMFIEACIEACMRPESVLTAMLPTPTVATMRRLLANIGRGLCTHAVARTRCCGAVYAYEVDGRGRATVMDDANLPSLLALPYLSPRWVGGETHARTRRFILGSHNPYRARGDKGKDGRAAFEGVGSPHTPAQYVWPLAMIAEGLTATDVATHLRVLEQLSASAVDEGMGANCPYDDLPSPYAAARCERHGTEASPSMGPPWRRRPCKRSPATAAAPQVAMRPRRHSPGWQRIPAAGYLHESFSVNDPRKFTRGWFAWPNAFLAEWADGLANGRALTPLPGMPPGAAAAADECLTMPHGYHDEQPPQDGLKPSTSKLPSVVVAQGCLLLCLCLALARTPLRRGLAACPRPRNPKQRSLIADRGE